MKRPPTFSRNIPGAATAYAPARVAQAITDRYHGLYFGPRGLRLHLEQQTVIQGGYTITYLGYGGAYGQGEGAYGSPTAWRIWAELTLSLPAAISLLRQWSTPPPQRSSDSTVNHALQPAWHRPNHLLSRLLS